MKPRLNLFALVACLFMAGCQTTLDPSGIYAGDKILFTADNTITGAYDAFNAFVSFEYQNRALLASKPQVKKAADDVRLHAKQWIDSAITLRDAYKAAPSENGRVALAGALEILSTALTQVALYMAPPSAPSAPATTTSSP